MMVSKGSVVSVEYTLRLDNQEVFESNVGDDPLHIPTARKRLYPDSKGAWKG